MAEQLIGNGAVAGMGTFTMPHHQFQTCEELRKAISGAWKKVRQERAYRALCERYEIEGDIRALEVTHGKNGWHPHLHVLFFSWTDAEQLAEFGKAVFAVWSRVIERMGYGACSVNAFGFSPIHNVEGVAEYVSKWDVSRELTSGSLDKRGKAQGSRTPFGILADLLDEKNADPGRDRSLFLEYSKAFKGARQLTWSKGLQPYRGVEKSDEELAQQAQEGEKLADIDPAVWRDISRLGLAVLCLIWSEESGPDHLVNMLRSQGIEFLTKPNLNGGITLYRPPDDEAPPLLSSSIPINHGSI
ncbi:MAG: hypothetical protein AAF808_06815 [Cyanobacteria bacterium P01_D01_bin.2]